MIRRYFVKGLEMKCIRIELMGRIAGVALVALALGAAAAAQEAGPIKPPPTPIPGTSPVPGTAPLPGTTNVPGPANGPQTSTGPAAGTGTDTTAGKANPATKTGTNIPTTVELAPPTMPVEDIIKKFAANEDAYKEARGNFTYTQTVIIKDFDPATGDPGGEYEDVRDVTFTPDGKRFENVTYAPANTLQYLILTPEDIADVRNIQPFVLTSDEIPQYDVRYVDHEPVDQLTAYVFEVVPKKIEKGKRYFQGKIWVDDKDFAIVKSHGKAVPDSKTNKFATFDTYRELIDGKYWFPTYTHADDVLHFDVPGTGGRNAKDGHGPITQDQRIIQTVKYENYKYFGSTIKIKPVGQQDKK
jgi:hypothetical protein